MEKLLKLLEGKKSYLCTILIAVYTLLKAFGVLDTTTGQDTAVYGLLVAIFGASIRSAINTEVKNLGTRLKGQ